MTEHLGPTIVLISFILSAAVMLQPRNTLLLMLLSVVYFCLQIDSLPNQNFSNSQLITALFTGTMNLSLVALILRYRTITISMDSWYSAFAPIGRCMLVTIYIYGTFHKINSDFLSIDSSCATQLWMNSPIPDVLKYASWAQYCAIYGTLAIETLALICLLIPRARYTGVIIGVAFHFFIGINNYYPYYFYSSICMLLHFLFMPHDCLDWFRTSSFGRYVSHRPSFMIVLKLCLPCAFILQSLHPEHQMPEVRMVWGIFGFAILCFVIAYGKDKNHSKTGHNAHYFYSPMIWLNLITVFFFFNGLTPYIGLKNTQAINMYSNLIIEDGKTNHLLFKTPPYLFNYLSDSVTIIDSSVPKLKYLTSSYRRKMAYYGLLSSMEYQRNNKHAWVSYERNGKTYLNMTFNDMPDKDMLHSRWIRKWLVFEPYSDTHRRFCRQ